MADNYNGIVIIDDSGSSGEEQKIYTKIFGYVIDENYNPVYSEAGKEPIVVKLNDLEYTLTTSSNYFEFDGQDIITLREGMITVFDGNEDTIFNWNAASHTFTGAAKTRLNIKIKMPYKRINMGDVRPEEMNLRTVTITVDNYISQYESVAERLVITAKDGNENDIDDFNLIMPFGGGQTITCDIQYGYMIKFVDPDGEFYDYTLTINTVGESAYTIHLSPKTPEVYISINVHIYDSEDHSEEITSSSWISIDGEDKPIGESTFNVTQYSTIIANNSEYLADYRIIESTTNPQTINFYLQKQANASGHTDEDWHEVYQGIPWYVDKIDLKYTAVDIYSSKKAQLTHEKINILPFTDTNCVGQYDGNVVESDGSTRPSRLNDLNYTRNVNINENIYQFLFELKKGNYPIDFLEAADKDTKTLELHTFEPTPIKVKQRKMNGGSPDYIKYNPQEGQGDPYIAAGANNIIGGFINVTYNGENDRPFANSIISAKYISGDGNPWNTIGLTSSQMASLDNVYLEPVINTANTDTDKIEVSEKQAHINRLSILYDNIICHSESYTFPYLPDGTSLNSVELIYGQKNKNINVGPLKYEFVQDEEESIIYSLQNAANEKYIPKFKIDEIRLGEGIWSNYTTEINNEYLKINTSNPILLESDSTLNIAYHMNDDAHAENQVISVNCSVVSSPEVILTGYTFNNVDNYNFKYITDSDVLVTENYFSGASPVNAALQYSFILYSKSPGDTPENLLTATIESQTGDISENGLTVHNNVSLSISDGSDIKYTLTSLAGTDSWMDYGSTINNAYNNILGTYYTKSGEHLLTAKTKNSYSYINDIIVNDNLSCSYKLNNNEYIYNVKSTDDKYNGKYYLYSNNEAFDELSIFGRWNEESNITYIYSTNNSLPGNGDIIRVQYTENNPVSFTASIYNLLSDGFVYMPSFVSNNAPLTLLKDTNIDHNLLKDRDIINEIKQKLNANIHHNWIVNTKEDGSDYANTLLYNSLADNTSTLYVGPHIEKNGNKYQIKYTNFESNSTITSRLDNEITSIINELSTSNISVDTNEYDYNFDSETVSKTVIEKYCSFYKNGNLSYNTIKSNNSIKDYYTESIYPYDLLKFGDDTSKYYKANGSFALYTNSTNQVNYNNFEEYVNTFTSNSGWQTTMGYTIAKSYIIGFGYSYAYEKITYNAEYGTYSVGDIILTDTNLYSYTISGNNVSSSIYSPTTTYNTLINTNTSDHNIHPISDGIELFKTSSNLVKDDELKFIKKYNEDALEHLNEAFVYNDQSTISLANMWTIFANKSIAITPLDSRSSNNSTTNLKTFLELDKKLKQLGLKLKGENVNYSDQIINYALALSNALNTFYPALKTVTYHKQNEQTSTSTIVYVQTQAGVQTIQNWLDNNNFDNPKYYYSTNGYPMGYRTEDIKDPTTGEVTGTRKIYVYNQNGTVTDIGESITSNTGICEVSSTSTVNPATYTDQQKDWSNCEFNNLFIIFRSCNLSTLNNKIDYAAATQYNLFAALSALGIDLLNGEYIQFDSNIYSIYNTYQAVFEEGLLTQYDTKNTNKYVENVLKFVKNISGNSTNGYETSENNSNITIYLNNKMLFGISHVCYTLIQESTQTFNNYKTNINSLTASFRNRRTQYLNSKLQINPPLDNPYPSISSFAIMQETNDNHGIAKYADINTEVKYLNDYGPEIMITNYLKRAGAYSKKINGNASNYANQLKNEIKVSAIIEEIQYVNRWITSRLLDYGKNTTDSIQYETFGNSILTFDPTWLNLITTNEYSVNTIYCNGYNIYKLSKPGIDDIYYEENILNYPGLHLRYVINESISEITANTDVYSMADIKKFRGTIYQTCEELKKRTNNVLHLLLYYYDGFIKEVKVTNNILNNAYKVNNIGCVYEEVNNNLVITFDASGISEDNMDTNKFSPSIEVEYCHTGESEYSEITVINNSGLYVGNIPLSGNKLCHIRYRMKWSSSTGISIYSGYNNIVYFYDPADDGYSYKSLEFTTLNGPTTQNINSILNNALDLQLFAKRSNTYYVADYRSSISNKNIGFKFIKTVNDEEQSITPVLSENYTNYSLNIITLDNIGNHFTPGTLPGVNSIITNKKYVLTKG